VLLPRPVVRFPKPAFQSKPFRLPKLRHALPGGLKPQVAVVRNPRQRGMDGKRRVRTSDHEVREGRPVLSREAIVEVDKRLLPAPAVALLETLFTPRSPLTAVLVSALRSAQTTPSLYGATSESGETAQKIFEKSPGKIPQKN
jgi:hypothetical protein